MVIIIVYTIIADKRQKQYIKNMKTYSTDNPDAIVSVEEFNRLFKEYNSVNIKSYDILIALFIIEILLAVLVICLLN